MEHLSEAEDGYDWGQCIDSSPYSGMESELYDLADRHSKVPGWLTLGEAVDFAFDCLNSFSTVRKVDAKDLEAVIRVLTNNGHCYDQDLAVCNAVSQIREKYTEYKATMGFESAAIKAKAEWLGQEISRLLNPEDDSE